MTFNKFSLTNIRTIPYPILVSLLNGYKFKVTEYGDAHITSKIVLNKVLHVPSYKYNLISIQSLVSSMKWMILFTDTTCLLLDSSVKRPQAIGSNKDGIYYMCGRCLKDTIDATKLVCSCLSHGCRCTSFPISVCNESSVKKCVEHSRKLYVVSVCSSTFNNTNMLNNCASL